MNPHPLADQFARVAGSYERGRPDYPAEVIGALIGELGLAAGDRVVDLAAGTGKLTRALLVGGLNVVGVEPLAEMRELLAARIGPERTLAGAAEAIPLADHSQRAATVADAFHWFDGPAALADIARVLAAGGGLALLATYPDWSGTSWGHELGTLINDARPEHPYFDGPSWEELIAAAGGWTVPREIRVTVNRPANVEAIPDYMLSMSWVAAMERERRAELVACVERLVSEGETPAELPVHFRIAITERA